MKRELRLKWETHTIFGKTRHFFRIVKQTHRGKEFTPTGCIFRRGNKIMIESRLLPAFSPGWALFVCGECCESDKNVVQCTTVQRRQIEAAVREYNETFAGDGKKTGKAKAKKDH